MKRFSMVFAALLVAAVFLFDSSQAQAKSSWFVGINSGPAYYAPAPVYYGYYAPPPPPVYYAPYPYYRSYWGAPVSFSFGYRHR